MPKQRTRGKRQEELIDVSEPQSFETYEAPAKKESGTKKKKKASVKQEQETEVFMKEESQKNADSDEEESQGIHLLYTEDELKDTIKKMTKNNLVTEYLALKQDYTKMQDRLEKKLKSLTEEPEKKGKCEAEVPAQQQHDLNQAKERIKSLEDTVLDFQQHSSDLKAERDAILKEIEKSNALKEEAVTEKEHLSEELEELKHQLSRQKDLQKENKELKEKLQTSQDELDSEREALLEEKKKSNTLEEAAEEKKLLLEELKELKHQLSLQESLQQENKELKDKLSSSQEELQAGREKAKMLQEAQEELSTVRRQAELLQSQLQSQLQKEVRSNADRATGDQRIIEDLRKKLRNTKHASLKKDKVLKENSEKLDVYLHSEKQLQRELEKLKVAQKNCQEELRAEKEKNKDLQKTHEELGASFKELSERYETEVSTARLQAELLQSQIQKEVQSKAKDDQRLIETLKDELKSIKKICLNKEKDLVDASEKLNMCSDSEKQLQRELEKLKVEWKNCQEKHNTELQAEKLKSQLLRDELLGSIKELSHRFDTEVLCSQKQQEEFSCLTNKLRAEVQTMKKALVEKDELLQSTAEETKALKEKLTVAENMYLSEIAALKAELRCMSTAHSQDTQPEAPAEGETQVLETATPAGPSRWKRFRHALGLRKPKRWKERREAPAAPQPPSESST